MMQLALDLAGGRIGASRITWQRSRGWVRSHYRMIAGESPTGFRIRHCGHQTALRGYYIVTPAGEIVAEKFRTAALAKAAAIELNHGGERP